MLNYLTIFASAFLFLPGALGHGSLVKPFSWIDTGGYVGMAPYSSCYAGALLPVSPIPFQGLSCYWFNNFTFIPGEPTLDPAMKTFRQHPFPVPVHPLDNTPWLAPGSAPVFSPCGVAGGNPNGCPPGSTQGAGDLCRGGGWAYGPLAEDYYVDPGFPNVMTTEWKIGSIVEAGWGMVANHGGGYSYRLCKVPEEGMGSLKEECFQQNHLEFSGDVQWVQYGDDAESKIEFEAHRTKEGTFPEGSEWTMNPIPACLFTSDPGPFGVYGAWDVNCTEGTQFPPPAPGLFGAGHGLPPALAPTFGFSIVDQLVVPNDMNPGEYVLSFRWDSEQTQQVWSQCANIKLVL